MEVVLRNIEKNDLAEAASIWNQVIEEANSFPGDTVLNNDEAWDMFCEQTETVCAVYNNRIVGVYILHPNNIGRCSHIANASYAVSKDARGMGVGRAMVTDSIERCKRNGYKGLQYNAVVATNYVAIALYLKLGFTIIGTIKNGYMKKDNTFEDTLIFLKTL